MNVKCRNFESSDLPLLEQIHAQNELPENCLPDLTITAPTGETIPNPLFVVKKVYQHEGKPMMICFVKVRSELYLFLDHTVATPEERWEALKEFKEYIKQEAWKLGLDQLTAFVPPEIDASFCKRLEEMGFIRSPWIPYSLNIG